MSRVGTCPPAIARPHDSPRIAATSERCPATTSRSAGRHVLDELADHFAAAIEQPLVEDTHGVEGGADLLLDQWPATSSPRQFVHGVHRVAESQLVQALEVAQPAAAFHVGGGELGVALEDVGGAGVQAQVDGVAQQRVDEIAVVVLTLLPSGGDGGHRRARRRVEVDARRPNHVGQRRRQPLRTEQCHGTGTGHWYTMSPMRATRRQPRSGQQRPAWPGNAVTVIGRGPGPSDRPGRASTAGDRSRDA